MELIIKVVKYELHNLFRSKWLVLYTLFYFSVSYLLFSFEGEGGRAMLTLLNITLIVIPLVSLIFGVMYHYNSREFIEMILCQPIDRRKLFFGLYLGSTIPLALSFAAGVSIPAMLFWGTMSFMQLFILLATGCSLSFIFTSLAFLVSIRYDDKIRGFGYALITWLLLAVIYDGLIITIVYFFSDYPIENAVIGLSVFNPVDLGRIFFMLNFDIAALMGYTGAVFKKFFGSTAGICISAASMLSWIILPFLLSLRLFSRKDF